MISMIKNEGVNRWIILLEPIIIQTEKLFR